MTTKLEAINTMLSCIGQAPLNTLEGTKSYFTIAAERILEDEVKRIQLQGWDFNSEDGYQLNPDVNNNITIPPNLIMVKFPTIYKNRYVVREGKLYDKFEHTYEIPRPLKCSVVWSFEFALLEVLRCGGRISRDHHPEQRGQRRARSSRRSPASLFSLSRRYKEGY